MIRESRSLDYLDLHALYRQVARESGGLIRTEQEVTFDYVRSMLLQVRLEGLSLVKLTNGQIIGEVHASRPGPEQRLNHVLGDLEMAVSPGFQGQGFGRELFQAFLAWVRRERPQIRRVEVVIQQSNHRGISLCHQLGFNKEGELKGRIQNRDGSLESVIVMAWHTGPLTAPSDGPPSGSGEMTLC